MILLECWKSRITETAKSLFDVAVSRDITDDTTFDEEYPAQTHQYVYRSPLGCFCWISWHEQLSFNIPTCFL